VTIMMGFIVICEQRTKISE